MSKQLNLLSAADTGKQKIVVPRKGETEQSHDDMMVQHMMTPSLLLDIFEEPIVFQRAFVKLTASATAALYLSYALYTSERLDKRAEGWFTKTITDWQKETGLSRFEQQAARKLLRDKEILIERKVGMPAQLLMKIDMQQLAYQLSEQSDANWASLLAG